jgi:cystathionine beta-lyase/cystathionine gamma-synthase
MGAIAGALTALSETGGRVVAARQLYGATAKLLTDELSRFGVETVWADMTDLAELKRVLSSPSILLVETLANPLVQVADLPAMAALCRASGSKLVVDSTFTSPFCMRPLEHGADLVIHSVTKFLGGHSDLTLGAVAGSRDLMQRVRWQAKLFGGSANPFECWLAVRGIATFTLRMERSCANAHVLAERLEAHPRVRRVYYPGLPSHPQFERAGELLDSPGPMLAFDAEDGTAARSVLRRLKHVRFAPSLGDVATTISYPAITSHRALTPAQRAEIGISDGTLRLSVGIDHVDDVWSDLAQALEA